MPTARFVYEFILRISAEGRAESEAVRCRAGAEGQEDGRAAGQEGLEAGTAGRGDDRAVGLGDGRAAGTEVCAFSDGEV